MTAEWYYTTNKQQMGPVSWDELRELADVGILKPHDMVWSEGMDEWVKAINQSGLFGNVEEGASPKAKNRPSKPPPGRRTRKKDEDEEEDDEEDEKEAKRKARKKEEDRAKMGVGFRVALGIGAVVGLLLLGVGACSCIAFITWGGGDKKPVPGPGPAPAPPAPVAAGLVRDNFVWNNLREQSFLEKQYRFTAGRRVTITVTNTLINPNTDVDLLVFKGGPAKQNQNNGFIAAADVRVPPQDRHCRVDFVVPANDVYWVRVVNLGPGMASACAVNIVEQ